MINELNRKKFLLAAVLITVSYDSLAVTPGSTQQAVSNIQPEVSLATAPKPVIQPGKPLSKKQKRALLEQLFKNPAFKNYILQKLKHPYYSETPKSVFTPAGTPMRWGGMGVVGNVVNRYPSQIHNSYDTGFSAALPFGNSENSIGGALAVGTAQIGPGIVHDSQTHFGQQGSVGLIFSRWLAKNTIATAGVANLIPWGTVARLSAKSYYGGITQVFGPTFQGAIHPVSATVGIGTGGFAPLSQRAPNLLPSNLSDNRASVFANASINLMPKLAVMGDYYSETFAAGIAYQTTMILPMNFMLYAGNLKHTRAAPSTTIGLRIGLGLPFPQ